MQDGRHFCQLRFEAVAADLAAGYKMAVPVPVPRQSTASDLARRVRQPIELDFFFRDRPTLIAAVGGVVDGVAEPDKQGRASGPRVLALGQDQAAGNLPNRVLL